MYRREFTFRLTQSFLVTSVAIAVVIGVVVGIFVMRLVLARNPLVGSYASIIASLVNAVQIQVKSLRGRFLKIFFVGRYVHHRHPILVLDRFGSSNLPPQVLNTVYGYIAVSLNDWENHRTATQYEDALIGKTFLFQFINSFAALFYVAFIKPFIPLIDPCKGSCMVELQTNLGTIFLTRLATGSIVAILVPNITTKLREWSESKGVGMEFLSDVELQYLQEEYHVTLGTFTDYAEMVIQFAYATMFISAYPLAMAMSLVTNYVELRIKAWKLCQICRRAEPRPCEDIGTWYTILEVISVAAVLCNSALVAFTGSYVSGYQWPVRVWIFIGMSTGILLVKYIVSTLVPDTPIDVEIQLQRKKYITDKVVDDIPDEDYSKLVKNVTTRNNYTIRINDDDPL
jgi:Calcium-activated chloride channel